MEFCRPNHISYDKFLLPLSQFNLLTTADSAILLYTRVPELTQWLKIIEVALLLQCYAWVSSTVIYGMRDCRL